MIFSIFRKYILLVSLLLLIFLPQSSFCADYSTYTSLDELLNEYPFHFYWNPLIDMGIISINDHILILKPSLSYVVLDYKRKISVVPPILKNGELMIPKSTIVKIAGLLKIKKIERNTPHVRVIMIDPGHGGKDPGTIGKNVIGKKLHVLKEKNVVLKIAKYVEKLLESKYPDKRIIMTRSDDSYPTLEERVNMANRIKLGKNDAMIFISIHANASFNKKAHGIEIWYLPPEYRRKLLSGKDMDENSREILPILNSMLEEEYTVESITLAKNILESMKKEVGDKTISRGLKAREWYVVRKAKMPSVLIEVGFVTNPKEMLLLEDDNYLKKLAIGIYNGICKFITGFENTKGFTE